MNCKRRRFYGKTDDRTIPLSTQKKQRLHPAGRSRKTGRIQQDGKLLGTRRLLPDIATIPALAELYGVTCDEILRAKRAPATDAAEGYEDEKARSYAFKAEKEASAIFDNMLARYENSQKIAVAATVFATIAAICAAVLTCALTNYTIAAFGIAVPVAVVSFFILFITKMIKCSCPFF